MGKLTGKVALITGAGAGLGAGISEAFAKHGAKLCLVDRADTVEQTAARLRQTYAGLEVITCIADVTNVEDLSSLEEYLTSLGRKHRAVGVRLSSFSVGSGVRSHSRAPDLSCCSLPVPTHCPLPHA